MSEIDNKELKTASTEKVAERTPREIESREASQRIQSWENPSNLPVLSIFGILEDQQFSNKSNGF